jgi:hypothetical protein
MWTINDIPTHEMIDDELVELSQAKREQMLIDWNIDAERIAKIPFEVCKEKAKALIAKTDWAVLPDVGLANQDAFVFYRLNLRNLIKNPVADPVFETEPTPIWS